MARLAESLMPLFDEDSTQAREIAQALLNAYAPEFQEKYFAMMGSKIGLNSVDTEDETLINDLLEIMRKSAMDYTQTFHLLTESQNSSGSDADLPSNLSHWTQRWHSRLAKQASEDVYKLMRSQNPVVIPRNHHMEATIESCVIDGSTAEAEAFLAVLKYPYLELDTTKHYQDPPVDGDRHYQTFCGT
jgi:uncharacterized protein YdiU (UPF0061 family)